MAENTEHCTACGSPVLYRTVSVGDYDNPNATQAVVWKCSNPACANANPANHDFDWCA